MVEPENDKIHRSPERDDASQQENDAGQPQNDAGQSENIVPGIEDRATELADLVDNLEERIVEERRGQGVPGNVDDRIEADPVDTGDRAPE
ncbi:hypothetical protein [Rhodococcus qingshengii]|uniref:hypothetical protein n=1 Tax=Rhodococcus qingshengii TaxID=334542 RepID=UPI0002B7C8DB|nr:hypothetical protein [Rhodococcus qingshengii]EME21136.1 hypothetical protein G418_13059 [Rhodococcus qingshengii BKS 20-40]